ARGLLLHSQFCSHDGPREKWAHYQYLFTCRKEPAAEWRCVCGFQVGLEWAELFGGRGAARAQYSGFSCLSWISGYRAEPACGKRFQENAATGRCGSRCWDAGDAGAAVVCQRDFAAADDEAVRPAFARITKKTPQNSLHILFPARQNKQLLVPPVLRGHNAHFPQRGQMIFSKRCVLALLGVIVCVFSLRCVAQNSAYDPDDYDDEDSVRYAYLSLRFDSDGAADANLTLDRKPLGEALKQIGIQQLTLTIDHPDVDFEQSSPENLYKEPSWVKARLNYEISLSAATNPPPIHIAYGFRNTDLYRSLGILLGF